MSGDHLLAVRVAYAAKRDGSGSVADFEKALEILNGKKVEGEKEYYLLMGGGSLIRLDDRVTIFTSEGSGKVFSAFIRGGDCLVRATKSQLLKQLDPNLELVLDPIASPLVAPVIAMSLSELPA